MTQEVREAQMGNGLQEHPGTSLMEKIFKLQSEVGKISKDKKNPFFKSNYVDINGILDEIRPLLKDNGLVLLQPIREGRVYSIIIDKDTGESEASYMELSNQSDPQKIGSEITYYRRYTLQSLLGLQAEDDDGNKASKGSPKNDTSRKSKHTDDDGKDWLNEGTKDWSNAEKKVRNGSIEPAELRDFYKVSNLNMEYFENLKKDRLAEMDNEFDKKPF